MRVLLINPPNNLNRILGKAEVFVSKIEPMGLLYIAAVLEKHGHQVKILDAFVENYGWKKIDNFIANYSPEVIGITCLTSTGSLTYRLGQLIKKKYPTIKIVLGNVHASVFSTAFLKNRVADVVVHGEGEYTMLEILEAFKKNGDLSGVLGVSWWNGRKVVDNPHRPPIKNLDEIPLPARHLLPAEKYSVENLSNFVFVNNTGKFMKEMFTSRGCVFQCKFCVIHNLSHGYYRYHSPQRVVDEMEFLVKKYNTGYIFIMDSLFIVNRQRVIEICKEIIKRKLDFKWGCEGHVKLVDLELLQRMERAGCYEMHFGIESGVQRLLDNVRKGITLEEVEKAVKLTKKTNIKVSGLFMLGLPGETYKDSLKTIDFACSLPLDFAQFSITVPYPGSQLFEDFAKSGKIKTGVRKDGTIDPLVWERFSAYSSFTKEKPIYVPEGMSADELKAVQKLALRRFYLRPKQIIRQIKRLKLSELPRMLLIFKSVFFN